MPCKRSHPAEDADEAAALDAPPSRIVKLNANADRLRALLQGLQDVTPADAAAPRESHSNTMTPVPAASTPAASAPTPPVKAEAVAPTTAASVAMPAEPAAHGAPTRVYLNAKVTQHLMEGMKELALKQYVLRSPPLSLATTRAQYYPHADFEGRDMNGGIGLANALSSHFLTGPSSPCASSASFYSSAVLRSRAPLVPRRAVPPPPMATVLLPPLPLLTTA